MNCSEIVSILSNVRWGERRATAAGSPRHRIRELESFSHDIIVPVNLRPQKVEYTFRTDLDPQAALLINVLAFRIRFYWLKFIFESIATTAFYRK